MDEFAPLKEQAALCRRLAADCLDASLKPALLALAANYDAKLRELEDRLRAAGDPNR
jgi:hypothetical protein